MKLMQTVDLSRFKLEKHVENALYFAKELSKKEPLDAAHILRAIISISGKQTSEAFNQLSELLPLTGLKSETGKKVETKRAPLKEIGLIPPLLDSFSIAEEFLIKNKGNIWGRDLITIVLLARNDDSLFDIMKEAGQSIEAVREKWYYFVTSQTKPHEIGDWSTWWEKAGLRMPDQQKETTPAYLLLWNPDLYTVERFRDVARHVKESSDAVAGWSMGSRKNVSIGDKVYLMRQGGEKPGIVGYGEIADKITSQPHFEPSRRASGETYNMAPVKWERLQEEPVIPLKDLVNETKEEKLWHSQGGGVEIVPELSRMLHQMWLNHIRKLFIKLKIQVYSDKTTDEQEDVLGYKNYSTAISEIIKENKDKEPYNIGIIAPWGHGKTTLMEFIREDFEPGFRKKESQNANQFKTTIKELKDWLTKK